MVTIIDGTNLILGRMATQVAQRALHGETIKVVNCEKIVISGNKGHIFGDYRHRLELGGPAKGPFYPRKADAMVRRSIRGMIPYKQGKGKMALERVTCNIGVPPELVGQKFETIPEADASRLKSAKTVPIADLAVYLGGKL
jgi:large subunit ribosomal protein L13